MRSWLVVALVATLWTFVTASALAGERDTIVLVAPTGDGFESRMRAELESMGFEVVVQGELTETPPGVLAVARIVGGPPRRIEVVVVSTDASLRVPSRTAIIDASASDDESVVSVRAAEQLRAFFQPLRPPTPSVPPAPLAPPLVPPLVPPLAPSRPIAIELLPQPSTSPPPLWVRDDAPMRSTATRETWLIGASAGPAFDVGGVGVDVLAWVRRRLGDRFAVGAFVAIPLTATTVEGTGGAADVRTGAVGADFALVFNPAGGAVLIMPSLGFCGALLATTGEASASYRAQSDSAVSAMGFGRLEIAPRIAGPVRLSAQGLVGLAIPPVAVRFASEEIATWGQPWAAATLGVGVGW